LAQPTESVAEGVAEALEQPLWRQVCCLYNPFDLAPQGRVENARVIGTDDEIDVGLDETVHGVQFRAGYAAESKI
jgi:hypothetical protein